ncbi:MAG: integrase [Firmicutes bacterium]|nr:integrase [Bacillota bacterium]
MKDYEQEINIYFELKGTPESSKESYFRRTQAFITFIQNQNKSIEDITESYIRQYILYLKKEKNLSVGTINNYISGIKFLYTFILDKEWSERKIPRIKRKPQFSCYSSQARCTEACECNCKSQT